MKIVIEGHEFDTSKAEKNYQLECMTDDIMAQAELLCNPLKTEGCGDAQVTALVLMQSLGRSALFPQLLTEAKKWKAKAIEERAIDDFGGESEGQNYHIDFAHIDTQAAQIEALKEKLVEERASWLLAVQTGKDCAVVPGKEELLEARTQLKAEMPEVGWE